MSFLHRSKASATKMTTSTKKLEAGISAEFMEQCSKLERLSTTLGKLAKHVSSVDQHWAAVAKSQRAFADDIAASYTTTDGVREALENAQEASHGVYGDITSVKSANHPTKTEAARLLDYKKEVDDLLKEKPEVVKAYSESQRYDAKADKLVVKAAKADEKKTKDAEAKATRNQDKKDAARSEYKSVCEDLTARMKETYAKHTDVLASAHESFWHIQSGASGVVHNHSQALAASSVVPAAAEGATAPASPRISAPAPPAPVKAAVRAVADPIPA